MAHMVAGRIGCRAIRDILTARNYKDTPPVHIKLPEMREIAEKALLIVSISAFDPYRQ
jgi:hypothetical protein